MSNKKDEILQNAVKLMYELGYNNCTLRKIAEASNISHVAVLKYFGNKHELASVLIERYLDGLLAITERFIKKNNDLLSQYHYPSILFYWCAYYELLKRDKKFMSFYTEYYHCENKAFVDIHYKHARITFNKLINFVWGENYLYRHLDTIAVSSVAMELVDLYFHAQITLPETITYLINIFLKIVDINEKASYDLVVTFIEEFIESGNHIKYDIFKDFLWK